MSGRRLTSVWRRSFPLRLAVVTAALFGLFIVVLGAGLFVTASGGLHRTVDESLLRTAQSTTELFAGRSLDALTEDMLQRGDSSAPLGRDREAFEHEVDEVEKRIAPLLKGPVTIHFQLVGTDGVLLGRSSSLGERAMPLIGEIGPLQPFTATLLPRHVGERVKSRHRASWIQRVVPPPNSVRAVWFPIRDEGDDGEPIAYVVAGVSTATVRDVLLGIARRGLAVLIAALVVAGLASAGLAWGAFRPVQRITAIAEAVDEATLDTRIETDVGDERLRRLVEVLNRMFARLESGFRARRSFLDDAAHELRTPLTSLRGELELALRRPRTALEYREAVGRALGEVDDLIELAESLLVIVRSGEAQKAERVNVRDVVKKALHHCRDSAQKKSVHLINEVCGTVDVDADPAALQRAMVNLVANGIQACPSEGKVKVAVRKETRGGRVGITVQDNGCGIPEDERRHIFDRFYQGDRSGKGGRAGLGLAIVREIVQAHKGRLEVESRVGEGSTFTIWLPATRDL